MLYCGFVYISVYPVYKFGKFVNFGLFTLGSERVKNKMKLMAKINYLNHLPFI